jgi:integrase
MSLYKRKDSSVYWVKFRHNGQTIQRSTGTADKLKAQEYHDRLKVELWEQAKLGAKPRRSWQDAVVRWLQETSDKRTHREDLVKLKWLDAHLGQLHLDEITLGVIDSIREARLKEGTKTTANRYLALVRAVLRRARDDWEWIDKVPKVKLYKEAEGRERALTPEEAKRLLDELPMHLRDMALFALLTGLRQANVLGLEWSKVDLERGHAWVASSASKNRRPISVPLNQDAITVLLRQAGKHPQRVFTYQGNPITNANTRAWREALTRAGIEDFRWHDLRHTWATWHRRAGTPTHELQRLGGWRTASMVERYAHLASDHLAESAARLGSVVAGYDLATVGTK